MVEAMATRRPSGVGWAWKKFRSWGPNLWKVPVPSGLVKKSGNRFMVPKCSQRVYTMRPSGRSEGSKSSDWLKLIRSRLPPSSSQA
jgi:hypothetical protein